jgi:protein TonB
MGHRPVGVVALWGIACLAAAAGHAAIAAIALNLTSADYAPNAAPPVVTIDLAPAAPLVPEQQAAPGPQAADSLVEPEVAPPEFIESVPELPTLPEEEQAVAVLPPMPQPRPDATPTEHGQPHEAKQKERKKTRKVASRAAAPATLDAQQSSRASAPAAGAARFSPAAAASWKSELMAQLNRYKRYPPGTDGIGTVLVAFSINRAGEVTSARLVRSSGDRALDQEAVALPRRASPLPPPPDGVGSGSTGLTVPIHFGR